MSYALALGRPEIYPELPVTLGGFKAEINQTLWLVKEATHTLADSSLVTALELEVRDDPTTDRHRTHFRQGGK